MTKHSLGILLTNTGTPDAPDAAAVRRYLREFLSDRRIVQLPRLIWLPLLYGLILPLRPAKSAALYQKIWTRDGSPMRVTMLALAPMLRDKLQQMGISEPCVELGMNYGNPSIPSALAKLQAAKIEQLVVLPLFPQYSETTTGSSFDRVGAALKKNTLLPAPECIRSYASDRSYITALAASVHASWEKNGAAPHLLISFHGIPKRFVAKGDPYFTECELTARLLAEALQLPPDRWTLCFQSQFGYDKWLTPATQTILSDLPARGLTEVDIICPGFAVDCLETLEEIQDRYRQRFLLAGGKRLQYIPALNDTPSHIDVLASLVYAKI